MSIAIFCTFTSSTKLQISIILKDLFTSNHKNSSTLYLNGVKAISTIGVIIYHSYSIRIIFPFKNGKNLEALLNGLFYQPLWTGHSFMEVFFITGGILTAKGLKNGFEG